jgi:hypothetical protein
MTVVTAGLVYGLGVQSGLLIVLGGRLRRLLGLERHRRLPLGLEG